MLKIWHSHKSLHWSIHCSLNAVIRPTSCVIACDRVLVHSVDGFRYSLMRTRPCEGTRPSCCWCVSKVTQRSGLYPCRPRRWRRWRRTRGPPLTRGSARSSAGRTAGPVSAAGPPWTTGRATCRFDPATSFLLRAAVSCRVAPQPARASQINAPF